MIEARTDGFAALAQRLTSRARHVAEARTENLARKRRDDPRRWRIARLLWPNFTQGS